MAQEIALPFKRTVGLRAARKERWFVARPLLRREVHRVTLPQNYLAPVQEVT
jgi:hypothetical protein